MRQIDDKISLFVREQFPAFYQEEGDMFQVFLEAYYEYLEQTDKAIHFSRNLLEYKDIDSTTAEFLEHFKKTFLAQLPGLVKADDRLTIKNIMDFYRAKGTPRAVQLLFRLIFDEAISINYPSDDVLKPSASDFKLPRYIEVYAGDLDKLISLQGVEIIGGTSGAKAFVESISTKILNKVKVHVLTLSGLRGNFLRGEIVAKSSDGNTDDMPVVTGSLSDINITLGGSDNKVGDIFNIIADSGKQGRARVTAVADATGLVEFTLANGGFGFSKDANITFTDVNDQNIEVTNKTNIAQSVSNVHVVLGANAHTFFAVGDSISVDTSTANGFIHAIGDATNASGQAPNTHVIVNNMFGTITTADKIANSTSGNTTVVSVGYDNNLLEKRIENAEFFRFETVRQDVETVDCLSAASLNQKLAAHNNATDGLPIVKGLNSTAGVIAQGYVIANTAGTGTANLTVAIISGSFGNQVQSTMNLTSNTHNFQNNEAVDEESEVTLTVFNNSSANLQVIFSTNDVVESDNSGANGVVAGVTNSTVMTLNGVFGQFTSNDNIFVSGAPGTTANVTDVNITTSGANGVVSTSTNVVPQSIVISDVVGAFTNGKKIKGRTTNAMAKMNVVSDTGASDVSFTNASGTVTATIQTTANVSVTGQVIGSNATNVGFKNTRFSNGGLGTFHNSAAAFVRGLDSNTFANVSAVGTGNGADFKIGLLENEDPITIYTDFIGENNVANVVYLDCLIDGGNSGIGFLDSVSVDTAGTNYSNGAYITFNNGGAGGGAPTSVANASITTDGSGAIISVTVVDQGAGYFTAADATLPSTTGDVAAVTGNFDFGYGFPKNQDGDFTSILDSVLTRISSNVGTITAFSDINPGNNYNFDPFVSVYSPGVAKFNRRDLVLNLTNMAQDSTGAYKDFIIGETVNQQVTIASQVITASAGFNLAGNSSLSGTTANSSVIQDMIGTTLRQRRQTGDGSNSNTTIDVLGEIISGNTTSVTVSNMRVKTDVNGAVTFSTTDTEPFDTPGNTIVFVEPGAGDANITSISATITGLGTVDSSATAKGQVYKFTNNGDGTGDVGLRRLSFSVGFNSTNTIIGAVSTAGGTLDSLYEDESTRPIGDNANVVADAKAANGIVTDVEVIDSGFGYQHNANLTLQSTNTQQQIVVSGTANVTTTGLGPGYWASKESFLNTKYIHDNDFYQSHSYVVESGLSLNKYRDILLKSTHIAGTKLFGRVLKESIANVAVTSSNNEIQRINSNSGTVLETRNT